MLLITVLLSIVFLPFSILGMCFCGSGRKNGVGGTAVTGTVFGIISTVLFGLGFLISCGGL